MKIRAVRLWTALILILTLTCGCSVPPELRLDNGDSHQARKRTAFLWVTADYGNRLIWAGTVRFSAGESVLKVMKRYVRVDTIYGGGFVQSINGYPGSLPDGRSGRDWFIYNNGVLSNRGAADIICQDGQMIWWDCHSWQGSAFVPAVIGSFPQPFAEAGRVTVVYTGKGTARYARFVAGLMAKRGIATAIKRAEEDQDYASVSEPLVVIGLWNDLNGLKSLGTMLKEPLRYGIFCSFRRGSLVALNGDGEEIKILGPGSGCIVAAGRGLQDTAPVWIITAADPEGLERVVRVWREHPGKLRYKFGLAVTPEETVPLPVIEYSQ